MLSRPFVTLSIVGHFIQIWSFYPDMVRILQTISSAEAVVSGLISLTLETYEALLFIEHKI